MRERRPTIRDVARKAGVGVGTVSRVLSESRHVHPDTRRRVLEAVELLGFRPSRMAQGLARGRTQTLGVLVPFFSKHYFLEILRGIERSAASNDYSLIIYNVERQEQALAHLDFLAKTRRVDGLIVIALSGDVIVEAYRERSPFPLVGVDTQIAGATCLLPEHDKGMYMAVRHLAERGHRRIALIDRPQDPVSGRVSPSRQEGYRKACREMGASDGRADSLLAEYSQEGGYEAAKRLLSRRQAPTAMACGSDLQAIGVVRAIEERGLRVGLDVAVTGYHDVELAQYVGLTTVRVPAFEMGEAATSRVVATLRKGSDDEEVVYYPTELIVRRSCGAAFRSTRG